MSSNKQEESPPLEVEVTIGGLKGVGEHEYVVAYTTGNDVLPKGTAITFSARFWSGKMLPQKGQVAIVRDVQQFAKGWRAFEVRPVSPATSKKSEVTRE